MLQRGQENVDEEFPADACGNQALPIGLKNQGPLLVFHLSEPGSLGGQQAALAIPYNLGRRNSAY
tara:strand:+ start:285 stop:479 length:195 start_codon:yes stop_codon:yes gene_type:complete